MANLNFLNASEMVDYLSNQRFNIVRCSVTAEKLLPVSARLSPALYWSGKEVLDEIEKMDSWISDLTKHRQALVNLLDQEAANG